MLYHFPFYCMSGHFLSSILNSLISAEDRPWFFKILIFVSWSSLILFRCFIMLFVTSANLACSWIAELGLSYLRHGRMDKHLRISMCTLYAPIYSSTTVIISWPLLYIQYDGCNLTIFAFWKSCKNIYKFKVLPPFQILKTIFAFESQLETFSNSKLIKFIKNYENNKYYNY